MRVHNIDYDYDTDHRYLRRYPLGRKKKRDSCGKEYERLDLMAFHHRASSGKVGENCKRTDCFRLRDYEHEWVRDGEKDSEIVE